MAWPLNGTASDDLAELACMSALARWLARWQPIHMHRAILAGAEPAAVAAALGGTVADAFGCWREWATGQQNTITCGKPGVTPEEYEAVACTFTLPCALSRPRDRGDNVE
jgi:hypothetical protein